MPPPPPEPIPTPAPTSAPARPTPSPPLWLLVMITVCGTMGMHALVPALPIMAADLQASAAAVQLTISLYLIGLAVGQLVHGPMSDRFGRKPVLLVGLALYAAAGLVAALSPSLHFLIVARLFQAFGGCVGLVLGRAIVRDTTTAQNAASQMATLTLVLSLSPGISPFFGGWIAVLAGWRWIFVALFLLTVVTLVAAWRRLPETGQRRAGGNLAGLLRDHARLLRSPVFIGFCLAGACFSTAAYAFLTAMPYIFAQRLGRPPQDVGLFYFVLLLGTMLGSMLASRLVRRIGTDRMMLVASAVAITGAATFLGLVLAEALTLFWTIGPVFLFTLAMGAGAPLALTRAISLNPATTGTAAGIYGCGQMLMGAVCTALAGLGPDAALASGMVLTTAALLGMVALLLAIRLGRSA